MCADTLCANQVTKPVLFKPSASAIRVANQTSVLQACLLLSMSSQLTIRVSTISETTISAAVVAFTKSPPKIHMASASSTRTARIISRRESPPMVLSSSSAQAGTSLPSLMVGG